MIKGETTRINGFDVKPVGLESLSAISVLPAVGNVVTRCCVIFDDKKQELGLEAATAFCREECDVRSLKLADYLVQKEQAVHIDCPEKNTLDGYDRLGVRPSEVIMVAVSGNNIGFSDQLEQYLDDGSASVNPEGWTDVKGCNAFFADTSECVRALGRRLADCGDLNIEFKTTDGRTIIGFMHLTRPGQTFGKPKYAFGEGEDKTSYLEYALRQGLDHFGEADMSTVSLSLRSAIEEEDFDWHFDSINAMESNLPGWLEDGYLKNVTNPAWTIDSGFDVADTWLADFRGIITRDILECLANLGIAPEKFDDHDMVNTMHSPDHSSHKRAFNEGLLDTRDLYVTVHNP